MKRHTRKYEGSVLVTQEMCTETENGFVLVEMKLQDLVTRAVKILREKLHTFKGDVFLELTVNDVTEG